MDNLNKAIDNNIEWKSVSDPIVKSESDSDDENIPNPIEDKSQKIRILSPVLSVQLIICFLILTFSFVAKNFFNDNFVRLKEIYDEEMCASMYFNGDFSDFNYVDLFEATNDEV